MFKKNKSQHIGEGKKNEVRLIGCRWKKLAATTKSMVNIMIGSRIYFLNRTYKQLHMIEHNARKSDHAYVFRYSHIKCFSKIFLMRAHVVIYRLKIWALQKWFKNTPIFSIHQKSSGNIHAQSTQ